MKKLVKRNIVKLLSMRREGARMKGSRSIRILVFLLLSTLFLVSACGQPTAEEPMEEPLVVDETAPIQWQDPALEALVREVLGKPEGEIYPTDLDHIWGVELWGDQHLFFNGEGGSEMYVDADGRYQEVRDPVEKRVIASSTELFLFPRDKEPRGNYLRNGAYTVNGETFNRGAISSLADFANFRNLRYLYVFKNDLQDVSGLSGLDELVELYLIDDNLQEVGTLSDLPHLEALTLSANFLEDISPLFQLTQLTNLVVRDNEIRSLEGIGALENLTRLNVANNHVDSLEPVADLPHLDGLVVSTNPIEDLEPIAGLTNLKNLYLDETQVHDLTPLQMLTSLEYVNITDLQVDRIDFAPLAVLPNLNSLVVGQSQAEIVNLRSLAEIPGLKTVNGQLDLVPSENIPEEDIAYLRKELPGCSFYL